MQFRLTYEGQLRPSQRDPLANERDRLATHKHGLRKHFHAQLKELWNANSALKSARLDWYPPMADGDDPLTKRQLLPMVETIARNNTLGNFHFVSLVRKDLKLLCDLDLIFLRSDAPGSLVQAGDLDNRIKTLIDGLRQPQNVRELSGQNPTLEENPFFCLLDDDNAITGLKVETDTLLIPDNSESEQFVKLLITVKIKPFEYVRFPSGFENIRLL